MFKFVMPKFIFKVEKWKWNNEFRVYVSNQGHYMDEHKKPIPVNINESGYVCVPTRYGWVFAHRLVMKTWKPTANMESLTVDHLDHNKRNNALDNLEWVTKDENQRRAERDFIPYIIKEKKRKAQGDNKNRKLKRYNRTDYTMDDFTFGVNGKYYPNLEEAHIAANSLLCQRVKGHNPDSFQIQHMQNKYQTLLNRCNCKDKKAIDGEISLVYFKYLHLSMKAVEQEDEV